MKTVSSNPLPAPRNASAQWSLQDVSSPPLHLHLSSRLLYGEWCTCNRTTGKSRSTAFSANETILSSLFSPQHRQLCLFLGVSLPRVAGHSRAVLPLFAKHTNTHTYTEECCGFFFFFSSRANPEPGPGLPLRCSLAHKHKTAFIILPVAAQGLASKSYWFLSSLSPLHKGRAFCKLLARFRPTKGTFIEPSPPPPTALSLYPPAIWFCSNLITRLEKGGEEKRRGNKKAPQMACSFSAVNGFIWAAFIHVAIQRRFSRFAKKRTWQNYWFGGFLTRLTRGTLRKKSLLSLSLSFFPLSLSLHLTLSLGRTP